MSLVSQIFAALAAALHVVFFLFESVLFRRPRVQKRFHVEPAAAEAVRSWAFNQGFYNLFLALGIFTGLALLHTGGDPSAARTLVLFPCACMVGAGAVLAGTDRRMLRAAIMQLAFPLVVLLAR